MRRLLFLAALIAPLLSGCDPAAPGTEPDDEPGPEPNPNPDTVPAIAFAAIEGTAPNPDTTLVYSCGPGLFGGSTKTDSAGNYNIALRFPDSLKTDLPSDRQLGCMVQIDPPSSSSYWYSLTVPIITFAEKKSDAQPVRADIDPYHPKAVTTHTTRGNVLLDLRQGEIKKLSSFSPCAPECSYYGIPLHPDIVEVTPISWGIPGGSISINGTAAGTTTIMVYGIYRNEHGTPEGWKIEEDTSLVGAIGVRVR